MPALRNQLQFAQDGKTGVQPPDTGYVHPTYPDRIRGLFQGRQDVLAKTGLPFVLLWRVGRGGFARGERAAFRYC